MTFQESQKLMKLITAQSAPLEHTNSMLRRRFSSETVCIGGLQPSWLRLQTKVLCATTRMQTLSSKHPLQKWLAEGMRTRTAHTLENILQQFPCMTEAIETIEPYIRPSWWAPKININIRPSKNEAKDHHHKMQESTNPTTAISDTDESGIANKIGSAT